ncbi:MAG TPA: hypothetical protein VF519_07930 [Mycobacteriales bacterium]|jgi:hypothetical protein
MKRTLSLKREALTPLTSDEMSGLAGAASWPTWVDPAVASVDPKTTCIALAESVLRCSGGGCNTWNSDCSCAPA